MSEKIPSMECGCGGREMDIFSYNVGLLTGRCRKCGQYKKIGNPSWPLTVGAVMLEKKVPQVVQVIDDAGVKAMIDEKDQENEALRRKLIDAGVDPDA